MTNLENELNEEYAEALEYHNHDVDLDVFKNNYLICKSYLLDFVKWSHDTKGESSIDNDGATCLEWYGKPDNRLLITFEPNGDLLVNLLRGKDLLAMRCKTNKTNYLIIKFCLGLL